MPLTDNAIKAAKAQEQTYRLSDEKGLYLLIKPAGFKWWRFDYRFVGTRKTLSLGVYPDVSLKLARQRRDEARQMIANGTDPSEIRKTEKATQSEKKKDQEKEKELERLKRTGEPLPGSFRAVSMDWIEKRLMGASKKYIQKVTNQLSTYAFPFVSDLPLAKITAPVALEVVRRVEAEGKHETAHRIKNHMSQVMRFAVVTGQAERNPINDLNGALVQKPPVKHHAAPCTPREAAPLIKRIYAFANSTDGRTRPLTRLALRLAPLVFIRPGEIIALEWRYVHWDCNEIRYTPNKTLRKTGVELIIPLTTQARAILEDARKISGTGKYIFAGSNPKRHMSENTINKALKRIGIDTQKELTGHGFRAIAATLLTEVHGYNRDVVELQLAHKLRDSNGGAYHRATYIEQRRKMMQIWSDYIDSMPI